jgi:hypothetical protein
VSIQLGNNNNKNKQKFGLIFLVVFGFLNILVGVFLALAIWKPQTRAALRIPQIILGILYLVCFGLGCLCLAKISTDSCDFELKFFKRRLDQNPKIELGFCKL